MADEQTTSYPIYNQYIYKQGVGWVLVGGAGGDSLPDQTDNAGKFLTTNGVATSWANVPETVNASSTSPKMDGTAAVGTENAYARGDHVHPTDTSRAAASHTHGNITNAGALQSTDITIANGDKLVVTDASNSNKVARTSASFDASTATKFLSKKGTFESAVTAVDTGSTNGTISVTIDGSASDVAVKGLGSAAYENSASLVHYATTQNANTVLAAKTSGTGSEFRKLVAADIPSITKSKISDFPTSMTPTSHTHGNLTNDGKITTTATIASGDKLVIVDTDTTAASKITGSSITFDGTTTTKALTPKGTWETFNNYSLPTASATTKGGIKVGSGLTMDSDILNHSNSITAGTAGTSSATSGATLAVPYITYDAQGHITGKGTHTHTIGSLAASAVTSGTFDAARIPTLAIGKIDSAAFNTAPSTSNLVATMADVNQAFAANDAMIFKGTIGTGGTVTALPNSHNAGDTYRVITAGKYANIQCEIGDLIICITDGTTANNAHWTVAQTNIDGAVVGPASATSGNIALFDGTTGKLIKNSSYSPSSFSASNHTHSVSITPTTTNVYSMNTVGSVTAGTKASFTRGAFTGGSYTQGTFTQGSLVMEMDSTDTKQVNITFTPPTHAADSFTAATHAADTFVQNTPTAVTLPQRIQVSGLWNGYTAATATANS